ncbi:mucin-13b isoform X1 [Sinocyclocheilus rhinocerous]|uniref:mucin-13b isoform X1 n=1 Tax=Sinocyclocheilus rhinocerous TaxID=307959 RepID=UPI0007B82160|nr:PREDICTED: mucin-13 isoform X1 [Sinocyclocheilus rhinocerous]
MDIPLKTILIFCLVAATTAQSTTDVTSSFTAESTDTPTSTTDAITVTTEATTDVTSSFTAESTDTPTSTTDAITVTTEAPEETSTGTFITDTTTDSTDDTPASTTAATATTTKQSPCDSSPCIGDSTCEERLGGFFVCICQPGLVYLEIRGCIQTKVFPGSLSLNRDYNQDMADKMSKEFQQIAGEIEKQLRNILGNDNGYINSIVLSLRSGSVIAEVQNFYDLSSSATSDSVGKKIDDAISEIINATNYTRGSMCDIDICDSTTTEACEEQVASGTVRCTCKEGYIRSQFTSLFCHPCPNGEMAVGEDSCKKCSFGFAGFNCNDPYLLVVTVVSTVLGALLIIFIVALIVVSCRNQKGSSSSQEDFSSSYGNKELHKPTGVPRIPRANPDAGWKSNNLEMTDSGSNQALVTRDRPESKARYTDYDEDVSNRGQVPPAYSGYGGRGVENGGVHNPYFRQDDDRMRRY